MKAILILLLLVLMTHAQQEELPTRQRRSHLSLRQEQQEQHQQQQPGDASPFLSEMLEIEAEMRRFWHRTLHYSTSFSTDSTSKAGKGGKKYKKKSKTGLDVDEGEEYVYGKSGGMKSGGMKSGKAGGSTVSHDDDDDDEPTSVKGTVKPTGYDSVKGTAAPSAAPTAELKPKGKASMATKRVR